MQLFLSFLGNDEEATEVLFKLLKFTDITDSKVIMFAIHNAMNLQHNARAVKLMLHHLESKPNSAEMETHVMTMFLNLNWDHCHNLARETFAARYPDNYELH